MSRNTSELMNDAYQLDAVIIDKAVHVRLRDLAMGFDLADGTYVYRASHPCKEGSIVARWLDNPAIEIDGEMMVWSS